MGSLAVPGLSSLGALTFSVRPGRDRENTVSISVHPGRGCGEDTFFQLDVGSCSEVACICIPCTLVHVEIVTCRSNGCSNESKNIVFASLTSTLCMVASPSFFFCLAELQRNPISTILDSGWQVLQ